MKTINSIKLNISEKELIEFISSWKAFKSNYSLINRKKSHEKILELWSFYQKKILDNNLLLNDYTNRLDNKDTNNPGGYLCNFLERTTSEAFGSSKPGSANNFEIKLNNDGKTYTIRKFLEKGESQNNFTQERAEREFEKWIKPLLYNIVRSTDAREVVDMIESSNYAAKQILAKLAVLSHLNDFLHIYKEKNIDVLHKNLINSTETTRFGKNRELRAVTNSIFHIKTPLDAVLLSIFLWDYSNAIISLEDNLLEKEFCNWFINIEGKKKSTLKTYLDSLKRIFPSLVKSKPYNKDNDFNIKSIFDIDSTKQLDSIIRKIVKNGKLDLSIDNYNHLRQSLKKYLKFLKQRNISSIIIRGNNMLQPLNSILFGPPGTGKTYSTVIKALSIIENKQENILENGTYKELKERYDTLVKNGQIVFTTFHQSMAYEDFVEGLKPITDDGKVTYEVVAGIFKTLCTNAESNKSNNFNDAYERLIKDMVKSEDEYLELQTKTNKSFWVSVNSNNNLSLYTTSNKNHQGSLTKEKLQLHSINNDTFLGWEGYADAVISELKSKYSLVNSDKDDSNKNYVLIIDEINRGNVSAIFGELITLIEDSKRQGKDEALEIILPYSKEPFSVPNNLHIIGTMNTADRSVEALDSALRRRFSFTEMPPKPELIKQPKKLNVDLVNLLEVINKRLEVLLDKDHLIGHSYFMKVTDINSLRHAFYHEIIPLLQEYFFGDYGKIALVLGEGFCVRKKINTSNLFAVVSDYEAPDYDDKLMFEINVLDDEEEFLKAIDVLLNKSGDKAQ